MNQVVLKLSKKRSAVKLIQSKEELRKLAEERNKKILSQVEIFEGEFHKEESLVPEDKEVKNKTRKINTDKIKKDIETIGNILEEELDTDIDIDIDKSLEETDTKESKKDLKPVFFDVSLEDILNSRDNSEELETKRKHSVYTEVYAIPDNSEPIEILVERPENNKISIEEANIQIQAAYQQGFDDCQEMAQINAQSKVSAAYKWVHRLDKLIVDLRKHYSSQLEELQKKALELVVLISGLVIEKEVREDNNIILLKIRKALKEIGEDTVFSIRVNPEMLDFLKQARTKITSTYKNTMGVEILTDVSLGYADCILTTSVGNIEARVSQQLDILRNEIIEIKKENIANTDVLQEILPVPDVEPLPANEDDFTII